MLLRRHKVIAKHLPRFRLLDAEMLVLNHFFRERAVEKFAGGAPLLAIGHE